MGGGMNLGTLTAILAVVDKISPAVSGIQSNVSKAMAGIKSTVTAAFSVAAVTAFLGKFSNLTGTLTDTAAKLGISTGAVQTLDLHFKAVGVSIDTVGNAIGEMGRRLVSGDSGAVNALAQLGLKASDLVKLQPDAAFTRIADAVAGIQNPMERATAAQEIFGRGGKELLAGLNGTLAESRAEYERLGLVLGDDVVAAGDEFGDVLGVLQTAGMALLAQVLKPMLPALTTLAQWLGQVAAGAIPALQGAFQGLIAKGLQAELWLRELVLRVTELGAKVPWLGEKLGASAETIAQLRERVQSAKDAIAAYAVETVKAEAPVRTMAAVAGLYGEHTRKAAEATDMVSGLLDPLTQLMIQGVVVLDRWGTETGESAAAMDELYAALARANGQVIAVTNNLASSVVGGWEPFKRSLEDSKDGAKGLGSAIRESLLESLKSVPGTLAAAFQGGGNIAGALKSIMSQVGAGLGEILGESFKSLGRFGGPIGAAVGSFLGPLTGLIGNLFGGAGKQANDLRDQIVATAGGIQELARRAVEAGTSVDALLRARNPEQVKAAWEALNGALNSHQEKLQLARQAMQEFGIDASQAGAAFKQAEMDETARSITEKLEAMMAVGVSTDAIIAGAGDEIANFIRESIRMGTAVPKEWQGIVEKMIEAGTLVDDQGTKLEDMSAIPWAETLNDKISSVMDKLALFLDRILDVPDALGRIPRNVTIDFEGRQTGDWPDGVPALATGGIVTRPTLALIGERGPEAVVPLNRAGALGVGGDARTEALLDRFERVLPLMLRDAVLEARAT